jgi:hypothetical protein
MVKSLRIWSANAAGPSVIFVTYWILCDAKAKLFVNQCPRVSARTPRAMKAEVQFFAGYLTLAFHEARNVRHLVSAGLLEKSAFRMLIDGLPANRIEAWRFLQPFRRKASEAPTGAEAESVFRNKFELSLEDLVVLSSNPHWEDRLEVIDGPKSMKA